jgi:hypothetical protein
VATGSADHRTAGHTLLAGVCQDDRLGAVTSHVKALAISSKHKMYSRIVNHGNSLAALGTTLRHLRNDFVRRLYPSEKGFRRDLTYGLRRK